MSERNQILAGVGLMALGMLAGALMGWWAFAVLATAVVVGVTLPLVVDRRDDRAGKATLVAAWVAFVLLTHHAPWLAIGACGVLVGWCAARRRPIAGEAGGAGRTANGPDDEGSDVPSGRMGFESPTPHSVHIWMRVTGQVGDPGLWRCTVCNWERWGE